MVSEQFGGFLTPDPYSLFPAFRYQLDFTTPGISPLSASARKHKRQMPNLRRNPRGRPHSWQRLCLRELNFGFRASFTLFAVVAIFPLQQLLAFSY